MQLMSDYVLLPELILSCLTCKAYESEKLSIMYWYVSVFIGMYRNLSLISGFYRSVSEFFVVSDLIGSYLLLSIPCGKINSSCFLSVESDSESENTYNFFTICAWKKHLNFFAVAMQVKSMHETRPLRC